MYISYSIMYNGYSNFFVRGLVNMKVYKDVLISEKKVVDVICNMCGDKIKKTSDNNIYDYFHAEKLWGYFSDMDGERHSFDLCENCYKKITKDFKIPVNKTEFQENHEK